MQQTLTRERADRMVAFACEHDDGTPQPRAYYDDRIGAVVLKSTLYYGKDESGADATTIELTSCRNARELRAALGY